MNTYYIGLTHDQVEIAAYVAWNNLAGIVFTVGLGFGIIGRRDVAHLLHHKSCDVHQHCEDIDEEILITQDLNYNFGIEDHREEPHKPEQHQVESEYPNDARNLAWFNLFKFTALHDQA